ncbi:uncharacterized protein [Littorina saxatilis]|uniref:Uncharacterized protein n=1 Tax=Littorina saxatilis TaxID=31220 RepID=A0AAN9GGS7_9CAEN
MAGKQTTGLADSASYDHTGCIRVFDANISCHLVARLVNSKIHVFVGNSREVIVCCPGKPTAFELQRGQDGTWQIWVSTCMGSVYRKTLALKKTGGTESMDIDEPDGCNHSIFGDLLSDPEPTFQDSDIPKNKGPDEHNVCDMCEKDKIVSCSGKVIGICCTEEFLALACLEAKEAVVLIYPMNRLSSENPDNFAHKLPLPTHRISAGLKSEEQSPKLQVVVSSDGNCSSSSQMFVPPHLFSSVFGWESSVRNLSALLYSLPDGSVYCHPVDLTTSNPVSSWRLLCTVDSPVKDILSIKVNRTLTERESIAADLQKSMGLTMAPSSHSTLDAVLVVGASGKCCLMAVMPTQGSVTTDFFGVTTVFTLPSRVQCCCSRDQTVFVSSGHTISKCSLTLCRDEGSECKQFGVDVNSEQLFSASVSSMWLSGPENTLVCETVNRDLVEFDTSVQATEDNKGSTGLHQPSLKELLLGVDVNQAKVTDLKTRQQEMNAFLQQLNLASHMLNFHHPHANTSGEAAPISSKVSIQSEVGYHAVEYHVAVKVTNQSGVALTEDWSLVATLCEVNGVRSSESQCPQHNEPPSSHAMKLSNGLEAGHTVYFKIPVQYSPSSPGLQVNVSLVLLSAQSLHAQSGKSEALQSGLVVPLRETMVDLFHFLHLRQPGFVLPQVADPVCVIRQTVAELKGSGRRTTDAEKKLSGQSYSISESLEVSAESSALSTPVDILLSVLGDSQSDLSSLTHSSVVLQAPCGSIVTVSVDPGAVDPAVVQEKTWTVVMKSSDILLLARARLALKRRMQKIPRQQRDVCVQEFHKMLRKTEALQQDLQNIQHEARGKSGAGSALHLTRLCSLYETMRTETFL